MDYLAIVKERAEGKDLSVLGGSVNLLLTIQLFLSMVLKVKLHQTTAKLPVLSQLTLKPCKQLWMDLQVHKLLL